MVYLAGTILLKATPFGTPLAQFFQGRGTEPPHQQVNRWIRYYINNFCTVVRLLRR
jgi:hypothetical protein